MKLQITNIKRNLSEEDLEKLFEKFGPIESCDLVMDDQTGHSKGFGFVVISDAESAKKAVADLNGRIVNGQKIKVKSLKY